MKKNIVRLARVGILLSFFLYLLWGCQEDFAKPTDKKQLKTVSIAEATALLQTEIAKNGEVRTRAGSGGLWAIPDLGAIAHEDLVNSEEKMTVIPVVEQPDEGYSRILLLKSNEGKIVKSILTLYPKGEVSEYFTGKLFIRELDGRFRLGYKVENGYTVGYYVLKNIKTRGNTNNSDDLEEIIRLTEVVCIGYRNMAKAEHFDEGYGEGGDALVQWAEKKAHNENKHESEESFDYKMNARFPKISPKQESDLPKKKPKEIIDDCNSLLDKMKKAMKDAYSKFSNYGGHTFGTGKKLPSFQDYLNTVKADPTHEHSASFSYASNEYYMGKITSEGESNRVHTEYSPYTIANIHNHPNNTPPSPMDIKTTLEIAKQAGNYDAFYTLMQNGTIYAFKVTDRNKVTQFMNKYGNQMTIDKNTNRFTENSIFGENWKKTETHFKKLGANVAWEYSIAYLFKKFDMGLTLLKKDAQNSTFKIQYVRKDANGKYNIYRCK